jgi:hypothetical protein
VLKNTRVLHLAFALGPGTCVGRNTKKEAEMSATEKKQGMTKAAVLRTIEDGATTMTAVVKGLGYKSVCGGTTKKIRGLLPEIDKLLGGKVKTKPVAKAKPAAKAKQKKTVKTKSSKKSPTEYPRAESNPFRAGTSCAYGVTYDVLWANKDKGIDRATLVQTVASITGKEARKAYFDVTVVLSSRPGPELGGDGGSHRSIAKAADTYYIEKKNGWVKLHRRSKSTEVSDFV